MTDELRSVTIEEFTAENRLAGTGVSFKEGLPLLIEIQGLAQLVSGIVWQTQAPDFTQLMSSLLSAIYSRVYQIVIVDVALLMKEAGDPEAKKVKRLNHLREALFEFYSRGGPRFSLLAQSTSFGKVESGFESLKRTADSRISQIQSGGQMQVAAFTKELAELKRQSDLATKQVEDAAKAAAELAKSAGVSAQAEHFATLQARYESEERRWYRIVVLLIVLSAVYVLCEVGPGLNKLDSNATAASIVSHTLPRVLIFSAIYFAIVWATRNMSAASHNVVINSHRVAALNTLKAFREGAEDDKPTRLAILIQVTTAIFSPQATGYMKDEPLPQEKAVVEIINKLAGGADGKMKPD